MFKVIEKVIIKIPIHLKRNAAHKPYLGSLRVVKQGPTSVTVALDTDPQIIKAVKTSEVFHFRELPIPSGEIGLISSLDRTLF